MASSLKLKNSNGATMTLENSDTNTTPKTVDIGKLAIIDESISIDDGNIISALTTNNTDDTSGRLLKVRDFGIGKALSTLVETDDLDALTAPGLYNAKRPPLNSPVYPSGDSTNRWITILVEVSEDTHIKQTATYIRPLNGLQNKTFTRVYYSVDAVWSDWVELYNNSNIVGTVSESGGIPSGAIIERGSDANGTYIKYADGTLITKQTVSLADGTAGTHTQTITLPAGHINTSYTVSVEMGASDIVNAGRFGWYLVERRTGRTTSGFDIYYSINTTLGSTFEIDITTIGTWF